MADINKETAEHTGIENVGQALSRAEQFVENNSKIITIVVLSIIVIVGGFFAYKKFYIAPMDKEAHEQMFVAEQYFEKDSFNLALNGDGNNWGFKKIISEYGSSKAANLSHYYAGICYLQTGKFNEAIEQLDAFDADDKLIAPIAKGATGDAYTELGNKEKALKYYLDAAYENENEFTSPIYLMKAGLTSELLGNFKKANELYLEIKNNYPRSNESRQVDKYITRTEVLLNGK